jgi:hypothetical protein
MSRSKRVKKAWRAANTKKSLKEFARWHTWNASISKKERVDFIGWTKSKRLSGVEPPF